MNYIALISVLLLLIGTVGTATAGTTEYNVDTIIQKGAGSDTYISVTPSDTWDTDFTFFWTATCDHVSGTTATYIQAYAAGVTQYGGAYEKFGSNANPPYYPGSVTGSVQDTAVGYNGYLGRFRFAVGGSGISEIELHATLIASDEFYNLTGSIGCIDTIQLYINHGGRWNIIEDDTVTGNSSYDYPIINGYNYRIVFDGAYYDFTCDGDEVFDYDACIWVYGYTCGVDSIKLYKDDSGWVLDDSVGQALGYDVYEMKIESGEDYKISFIDNTIDGAIIVHNQTFSCTGDHVLIDFDRCQWVYPPNGPDIPIYLWTGYDYNVIVFKDSHGNMVENSQLAIYDETDSQYLQKWTDASDGYTLLGARFDTDHDVRLSLRTFDGVFTLDTTYPANGSALVGEENITTTNWTIPIKYNLNVLPVDQYGVSIFDVFCGLSEYTPLNPGAFWGMDLSDQGYVPVTNCSGFAMCDIIAEKEGYADFKVEALNWTSKSAMVKDYRHNVVMEEE